MPEKDRGEIGGPLTPLERERSERILEIVFPNGLPSLASSNTLSGLERRYFVPDPSGELEEVDTVVATPVVTRQPSQRPEVISKPKKISKTEYFFSSLVNTFLRLYIKLDGRSRKN